jgi:Flp pilus assembly protein TadB
MSGAALAAVAAAAVLCGVAAIVLGARGSTGPARPPSRGDDLLRRIVGLDLPAAARNRRIGLAIAGLLVLAVGWLYSGIPAVGLVAGGAVIAAPWLFGAGVAEKRSLARLEAVEVWTRRLADLVRAGGGLHQAILVSSSEAPAAITTEVNLLATELGSSISTAEALHRFADRLADPTSDEVVAALILNAKERGPKLADVLDRVTEGMADLLTMRREITAGRTDARLSGNILTGLTLIGLLVLLVNKGYMQPYHTFVGQVVMIAAVIVCALLLLWMRKLNTPRRIPRILRRQATRQRGAS